jgi:pyruvate formate lyase activating enzyme
VIAPGKSGVCHGRINAGGVLALQNYGRVATAHVDTIEKKPAYHFRPGSKLLSIGTVGCNWSCDFCINSPISQTSEMRGETLAPEDIIRRATQNRCQGIAYTYNEPLVFIEFARDTGILAHKAGLFNVIVSNGYGTPEAVNALSEFADCVVVGLKANASSSFLKKHSGVRNPESIYETMLRLRRKTGAHIEVSDLVLQRGAESLERERRLCRWIRREMGPDTPLHLVRFHPSYKAKKKTPTSSRVLESHLKVAKEAGLRYVYVANSPGHENESTFCPSCGEVVIKRYAYDIQDWKLDRENKCSACGYPIPMVGGLAKTPPEERYAPVVFPPMDMLYVCEGLSG